MAKNISRRERIVRFSASLALVIIALLGSFSTVFVWALYGVAFLLLFTAAVSHCPVYHAAAYVRNPTRQGARAAPR